ncbi:T9SS type A sorting domain-containing protein [candidate division WOR-3 bacterium]|nr:T9SS type A sorting domain-containing protein [candidate division WOR-3 bacterium]
MADGQVLAADPSNDSIFWSGGKWYYMSTCVSTNEGLSWTRYNLSTAEGWTYAIAVDYTNSNTVYAGGIPYVYRTTDFGQTWTACSTGISGYANTLRISKLDPACIVTGTASGVYMSSNSGNTWEHIGCSDVNDVLLNPQSQDTIIAATDAGIYITPDQGVNWTCMGLDSEYVHHLDEYPDNYYYAGTYGSGVFRWPIDVGTEEHHPVHPVRFNISAYPNPFSRSATFTYTLPSVARVSIVLYDILGRHIRTLFTQHQGAGQHIFEWDGTDARGMECAPGIYFYTLTLHAGPVVRSGSIIRLK